MRRARDSADGTTDDGRRTTDDARATRARERRAARAMATRANARGARATRAIAPTVTSRVARGRRVADKTRGTRGMTAAASVASTNESAEAAAAPAVVSTSTFASADDAELRMTCEAFAPGSAFALTDTSGGVNNHVRYCDCENGERFVVRLYNNGRETDRVAFEHAVLRAVEPKVAACDSGFVVPRALEAKDGSGARYVVLPSGDCGSVFELIPGSLPKTRFADAVGEATAALSKCMEEAESEVRAVAPVSPTSVYRDIFGAFIKKGGSRDAFFVEAETNPGLDAVRVSVNDLLNSIRVLEEKLADIESSGGLPETLIHGDVHYDNSLADETTGKVTGIIDFEFASYDWRMMEAAAGLSKYVGERDPLPFVVDYIKGFCRRATPTEAEIDALPDLIKLRVLETVVYFVARSAAKEDDISQLALRAENYAARVRWIDANAQVIRDTMRTALA